MRRKKNAKHKKKKVSFIRPIHPFACPGRCIRPVALFVGAWDLKIVGQTVFGISISWGNSIGMCILCLTGMNSTKIIKIN